MAKSQTLVPLTEIEHAILTIRGERVMLDQELARLYGVSTGRLNEAVKRNKDRFPHDFMFKLTKPEWDALSSDFEIANKSRGGRQTPPYVFTEHGTVMLANVLNSKTAVQTSIQIVRAFIKMRVVLGQHTELASKLIQLENKVYGHDQQISSLIATIRQLMAPPTSTKRKIGF